MRNLSERGLRSSYAEETGDVFLALLEIHEDTLQDPILVVNNTVSIMHGGDKYHPFPFELTLPANDGETLPAMQLTISNVSLKLIGLIRGMNAPATAKLTIVIAETPDVIEMQVQRMTVRRISADIQVIVFDILNDDFLSARWPADDYGQADYRGLYK